MAAPMWLPSAIVRKRDGLVAAVLEPRRVQVLNVAATCPADNRTLAEVGICGHSISALMLDPTRDVVYTCGSDATLRAWNVKSKLQRWVWTDHSAERTTIGQLRIRNARRDALDQQWRHKRNFSRMAGEPQMYVTKDTLWVSGPSTLRAFDRRRGQELWRLHLDPMSADASLCVAHGDILVSVQHEVSGKCQLVAYAEPGTALWHQQLRAETWVHWLIGMSNRLFYVEHRESVEQRGNTARQELVSRDLATGEQLWCVPHTRYSESGLMVKLEACGGLLWCFCGAGRELWAIDPSNGSPRWSVELTANVHAHGYFLTTTCVAVWSSKIFVSDGKRIHALHVSSGEPVNDWAQAGIMKVGSGFHDQPPPTLVTCESGLLVLQRTVGERTSTECTLSCFDCESNGKLLWKAGAHRSAGTITLHHGMESLIGSSRIPSAGNDTSAAGQIDLHIFQADSGRLWAIHSVPANESRWKFVPGGVIVHITRGRASRDGLRMSSSDKSATVDGHRASDCLQCLDHRRQHDYTLLHNVASVSSGHLDVAAAAARAAALRWTWSSPSGKDIDAWTVNRSSGDIFVLTHDRVVHVLDSLTGVVNRSFNPGSVVPSSRHGRQEPSVGLKYLLICDDRLMVRGVRCLEGIMFSAITGEEKWRPDAYAGAVTGETTTARPRTARRPSTAGARAEVGAGAVLLSPSIVVTLSLAPIERGSNKATGTIFGRMAQTGTLLWSMPLSDEISGAGAVKCGVEIWPLRRYSKETKLLSLDSTPSADVDALHFGRIASALALEESTRGSRLYVVTKRSSRRGVAGSRHRVRPAPSRYHIRCFDASPAELSTDGCLDYKLGQPYTGELWHYPPGHEENGWEDAISCMEITASAVVIGSVSGKMYVLGPERGNLIKLIDWLHVDEISALANGNGMLWSASSQLAVLRLKPLAQFGVVAAATQPQLSSRGSRFQALWLVTIEFWLAVFLAVVEAVQLFRFAAASEVCSESSTSRSTCIHSYQMKVTGTECSANISKTTAPILPLTPAQQNRTAAHYDSECCACGGGETSDNVLGLPPSVSAMLKKVSNVGLDAIDPILAVWTGCSLIICFLTVFALAEPLKRKAFFSSDSWQVLLSGVSAFANLMCQPMLVPTLRLVSRGLDCSYYDGYGWLLDNSGSRLQMPTINANNSDELQPLLTEYDWQRCWTGVHVQLLALPAFLSLVFYVPACIRLLRVGGSLQALSKDVSTVFKPWAWCSSKDDDVESANRHPFSMRDNTHKLLVVGLKAVGVLATVFLGTRHHALVSGVLVFIAACMVVLSCTLSPFHGEAANRFRASVDFALLTSYVAGFVLAMLLEQTETTVYRFDGAHQAVLYYPSEGSRVIASAIANWLPILVGLSLICGWFTRRIVHQSRTRWSRRRVHARLPPPHLDDLQSKSHSDAKDYEAVDVQVEQNAALIIQRRQRTRSSGRRLAAGMMSEVDPATAVATTKFGFAPTQLPNATTANCVDGTRNGVKAANKRIPAQLPPLVPARTGVKSLRKTGAPRQA